MCWWWWWWGGGRGVWFPGPPSSTAYGLTAVLDRCQSTCTGVFCSGPFPAYDCVLCISILGYSHKMLELRSRDANTVCKDVGRPQEAYASGTDCITPDKTFKINGFNLLIIIYALLTSLYQPLNKFSIICCELYITRILILYDCDIRNTCICIHCNHMQ